MRYLLRNFGDFMTTNPILYLEENHIGRDFIVGDIHGRLQLPFCDSWKKFLLTLIVIDCFV